jgi:3-deoxy-D-manno-octulosonic-acid transferase
MIRFLYNILFPVALLFFLPGYIVTMLRRGNYQKNFGQRLAFYDYATRARLAQGTHTWMHAVSVGEVMIALKLAARMKQLTPALRIALTTTTTTGFALATRQPSDWIEVLYTPLDFWPVMRRAFAVIRPSGIVLVEAEVWPNLVAIAHHRRIPLALVNARLSPRSEKRFRLFNRFLKPYFQKLDLICVQEPEDVSRWQSLGGRPDCIHSVGSIKFDPENVGPRAAGPRAVLRAFGVEEARPILLAGSTHPGEEEILGAAFLKLRNEFPDLFFVVAPRHAERALEVVSQLRAIGLSPASRSAARASPVTDSLVLDTTGELRDWYSVAIIVFIGKSLTAHGGQNPVEAIVAGRPVVFGPNMENFAALAGQLVAAGGALQVRNPEELVDAFTTLLRNPSHREEIVGRTRQVLDRHRGATERTAQLLKRVESQAA